MKRGSGTQGTAAAATLLAVDPGELRRSAGDAKEAWPTRCGRRIPRA